MKAKLKLALICIFVILTIAIYILLFAIYGSNAGFRDWLVNTAMGTAKHQYLAKMFYDDEIIQDSLNKNAISDFAFTTNLNEIKFVDYSKMKDIEYENDYERQILEKNKDNNDYKIIEITGEKYHGYLTVIYEPERVDVAVTKYLGESRTVFNKNFRTK